MSRFVPSTPSGCDIVVVCAIDEELEAVKNAAGKEWKRVPTTQSDAYPYESTTVKTVEGTEVRLVAATASQMGLTPSAVLATKMILRFRPRLVAMVGVAAGVAKKGRNFGDVLVPDATFDYESGKVTRDGEAVTFEPSPTPLDVSSDLTQCLKLYATSERLDDIRRRYQGVKTDAILKVHIGPIGSGSSVVSDSERVSTIVENFSRKIIGIEMELYAVHRACKDACRPSPTFLGMKSIMDFGHAKTDDSKHYAAYTSATLFCHFIRDRWIQLSLPHTRPDEQKKASHLNEVIRLGVESLHALLPSAKINGRYFALDEADNRAILRRMNHLHVESTIMTGELALDFAYLDSDKLVICESFNQRRTIFRKLPPPRQRSYDARIAGQIDPRQKWVLCSPVLNGNDAVGVLCFFSRDRIVYSSSNKDKLEQISVAAARAFGSALSVSTE